MNNVIQDLVDKAKAAVKREMGQSIVPEVYSDAMFQDIFASAIIDVCLEEAYAIGDNLFDNDDMHGANVAYLIGNRIQSHFKIHDREVPTLTYEEEDFLTKISTSKNFTFEAAKKFWLTPPNRLK